MKKFLIAGALTLLMLPSLALAATFRVDGNVATGETVQGNLYLTGPNPTVGGNVQGDLYLAGGNVVVTGNVRDDLVVAGGNVTLTGTVGGDVRAFGGTVSLDGQVNGEMIVSGGEVKLGANSVVLGDFVAHGGKVTVADGAQVSGESMVTSADDFEEERDKFAENFGQFVQGAFWVAQFFALLAYFVVAGVLLGLFPNVLKKVAGMGMGKKEFWPSLGLGLLLFISVPVVAVILLATGFGAILGGLLMLSYIAYILLNLVFGGMLFGEAVKKFVMKTKNGPDWKSVLGGILGLHVVSLIPVVGWLIGLVFFLFSWGTLARTHWDVARNIR